VLLGFNGIFLPINQGIGTILPVKHGSRIDAEQVARFRACMAGMTR
jgi:hypothetical protein